MRWFPWWNRAIKRQRRDRFSSTLLSHRLSSTLLAAHSSWHHGDGEYIHAIGEVETDSLTELIQRKSGRISLLKSTWYCAPFVGDLEVRRVMPLLTVGQQPSVLACMDNSWFWPPEDWNKPDRNYLVDKGRSKGKARSAGVNLPHHYESHFLMAEGWRVSCHWVDGSVQLLGPRHLDDFWPDKHEMWCKYSMYKGLTLEH